MVTCIIGIHVCDKFIHRCKKIREEAFDEEVINAKKDTTRPSNKYYGLNWGYRSDETVSLLLSFILFSLKFLFFID